MKYRCLLPSLVLGLLLAAPAHARPANGSLWSWFPFSAPSLNGVSTVMTGLPAQVWKQVSQLPGLANAAYKGGLPPETRRAIRAILQQVPATPRTEQLQSKAHRLFDEMGQLQRAATSTSLEKLQVENRTAQLVAKVEALNAELDQEQGQRQEVLRHLADQISPNTGSALPQAIPPQVVPPQVVPPEVIPPQIVPPAPLLPVGPDYAHLQKGDILLRKSGAKLNFLWAMTYSHAGIFTGYDDSGRGWVYESNAFEGVQRRPLDEWKRPGDYVALGRWNKETPATDPEDPAPRQAQAALGSALDWATEKWGSDRTPYNFYYPDHLTNRRLYCSQLVWKVFDHIQIDLNSNDPRYMTWLAGRYGDWIIDYAGVPAIAPDEIYLSPNLTFYSQGKN